MHHWGVALCITAALSLVSMAPTSAQEVERALPPSCAAAVAAEPPEESSPIGHTLNVDEPHAGLLLAAGALVARLGAAATVPEAAVAFICAELSFLDAGIDLSAIEERFGRDASVRGIAHAQAVDAQAERAALIEALAARGSQ